ncbi:MAG: prepilin-type N-terminal cleavage/methylation domain-containing protein [Patescibacteria group bacterium]
MFFNAILKNKSSGVTLIELLVAISIFTVLIFFIASMIPNIFTNSKQQLLSLDNVDYSRLVTSQFVNEIRNATTGEDGSYPLNQADDSQIVFYSKAASSGTTVNKIRYYLSGNTLYKGVIIPTGSPLTYNVSSEILKIAQSGVANGSNPLFYYYDGNYNGSTNALSQPINVNLVKFVKINLMILKEVKAQDTSVFSISAGAAIRNLKTNLGN